MDENRLFFGDHLSIQNLTENTYLRRLKVLEQSCVNEKRRFPAEHYKAESKARAV